MAALVVTLFLVLSSCATRADAQSAPAGDDRQGKVEVVGWSVFHAAAYQWQIIFALKKVGPPWAHNISLVEQLRPGAKAPRYRGKLPLNTIVAPATPTTVGSGGEYGWRKAPDLSIEELHNGADIGAAQGSDVVAAMEGVVRAVFWDVWGGNRVEVAHSNDMISTYNHLDTVLVEEDDTLQASQKLGTVGQTGSRVTGPHLHFETWVAGETVDPQSFDWIVGDDIIPAPRDHARNPPVIPRDGLGDRSSIDSSQAACPYEDSDPKRCAPPDIVTTTSDEGPKPPDDGGSTPPTLTSWPDLSSAECVSTAPGFFDCVPVPGTAPGAEDCPTAAVEEARTDCPATPPEWSDLNQCRPTDLGTLDCVPFAQVPGTPAGPEDCPPAQVEGARTDCPPPWPDLSSAECVSPAPGIFDCMPFAPEAAPGPEDCLESPVEGARTDCPAIPPDRENQEQCRPTDLGTIDCVPFAQVPGTPAGPEDCPPAQFEGARTDCPPTATELPSPSGIPSSPPTGGEVAPFPGTEATLLGRRRTRGPAGAQPDPQRSPW